MRQSVSCMGRLRMVGRQWVRSFLLLLTHRADRPQLYIGKKEVTRGVVQLCELVLVELFQKLTQKLTQTMVTMTTPHTIITMATRCGHTMRVALLKNSLPNSSVTTGAV